MSIYSIIRDFFADPVKNNISITTPAVQVQAAGAEEVLPELLASSENLMVSDVYSGRRNNKAASPNRYSNAQIKANKKELRHKHGIGWGEFFLYRAKRFLGLQKLMADEIMTKYGLSQQASMEDLHNAIREYCRAQIGDTRGLTKEEIEKKYAELQRTFIKDIETLPEDDPKRDLYIRVYIAVIGEMMANDRGILARDIKKIAISDVELNEIGNDLYNDAEYNLMNEDAIGEVPSQEVAVEYHKEALDCMDESSVMRASGSIQQRAQRVVDRIAELQNIANRNADEEAELRNLLVEYQNLVVAGYAGFDLAMPVNRFVSDEVMAELLGKMGSSAQQLGIEADVFNAVATYITQHQEYEETVYDLRGKGVAEIIVNATEGRYSEYTESPEKYSQKYGKSVVQKKPQTQLSNASEPDKNISDEQSQQQAEIVVPYYQSITTDNGKQSGRNVTNLFTVYGSNYLVGNAVLGKHYAQNSKAATKTNDEAAANINSSSDEPKNVPQNVQLQKAMQGGVKEYRAYLKENKISDVDALVAAFNYDQTSSSVMQEARESFKRLDKSMKEIVFAMLHTSGQIEVSKIMDAEELVSIKRFNSTYAREFVERRCEEEQKRNSDFAGRMEELYLT